MAKKKKRTKRRVVRVAKRSVGRATRKAQMIAGLPQTQALGALIYGGTRARVSNALRNQGITQKIPAGNLADEVAMGTVSWLLANGKISKNKQLKAVGKAGLMLEMARVGETLAIEGVQGITPGTATTSSFGATVI